MKNRSLKLFVFVGVILFTVTSCIKDLNREPFYEVTSANVYKDFSNYRLILAKCYAGIALSGQSGPSGRPDISGIDEGFSNYIRQYWKAQELTTDEAKIAWNDGTIQDYNKNTWTPSSEFVSALYNRIFYQVTLCNEFIRETTDELLAERGITGANAETVRKYRAEVRFLRALSYYHALDFFGNVPFVTENDKTGAFLPKQTTRAELYSYIESELLDIENQIATVKTNEYARADQAAVWTLLTKLYINAEVYVGTPKYTETITFSKKVIDAGYSLDNSYAGLFLTTNNISNEVIFPIAYDGLRSLNYGGVTFLVHAPVGGNMVAAEYGINGGWGGLRTTKTFVEKFGDITTTNDSRSQFFTDGQSLEIDDLFDFKQGYAISKFRNVDANGTAGSDITGNFPDTDYPMFRLADLYLTYAEAVLRGGTGGDAATALNYVNNIRSRAYGDNSGDITAAELNLDFILDERARELYWEGHRRTDLIRFGKFSGNAYNWPWKGGTKDGQSFDEYLNLFPIPTNDLTANPTLKQNTGY